MKLVKHARDAFYDRGYAALFGENISGWWGFSTEGLSTVPNIVCFSVAGLGHGISLNSQIFLVKPDFG